jgi:hypothetical protein
VPDHEGYNQERLCKVCRMTQCLEATVRAIYEKSVNEMAQHLVRWDHRGAARTIWSVPQIDPGTSNGGS